MVERELDVKPHDFRRWVCLHEETQRTQFTSVPWLRPYVQEQMSEFLLASDPRPGPRSWTGSARPPTQSPGTGARRREGESLIESHPEPPKQRKILDRMTSVMTLVEGHGDYVMDAVGPAVVPSVAEIRAKFSARRGSAGRMEQAIRRVLGIDLKMKQYEQGSRFVKAVVDEAGMAAFNRVWTSPDTLPTRDELQNPHSWLERVDHGTPAVIAPRPMGSRPADSQVQLAVRCSTAGPGAGAGRTEAGRRCDRGTPSGSACPRSQPGDLVLAARSGGADSLALAAAVAFEAPKAGIWLRRHHYRPWPPARARRSRQRGSAAC